MKSCQICDSKRKIEQVMHEYKEGKLHSNGATGKAVSSRKQAVAIAMSEGRKQCNCKK
jgi:hypothetical protein